MSENVELSAIVPVCEFAESDDALAREYFAELEALGRTFELLFVLDGDCGPLRDPLIRLAESNKNVRIIEFAKSFGEATALTAGLEHTTGEIVMTLPAYRQVEHPDIAGAIDSLGDYDLVVGRRCQKNRGKQSGGLNRQLFHWLVGKVTGYEFSDLGCGFRILKRKVAREIPIYGDQYRFIPLIAAQRGFRVSEFDVTTGGSNVHGGRGIKVYLARLLDILTILFLSRFTKRPLRFFGTLGGVTFAFGAVFLAFVVTERLFFAQPLADRPALLLSSLLVVLGLQLFALGLLGELIIFTHARRVKEYTIDRMVN